MRLIAILLALSTAACTALVEEENPTAMTTVTQAIAVTQEQRPTPTSTALKATATVRATATPDATLTPGPVTISVAKSVYQQGEPVEFTITNHLTRTIYYGYGCGWPIPVYVDGNNRHELQVEIAEGVPRTSELKSGESEICVWNQQAYQAPGRKPPERFRHYAELTLVPSGPYQFRLDYFFDREEVRFSPPARDESPTVYSQVFNIEEQ